MRCQPPTLFPVLLLTSSWYHKYSGEFLSNLCWWGQFHTDSKICGTGWQKVMRELFCVGATCVARGCSPSCSWWPQRWYAIIKEVITAQNKQPHSWHSAPLSTLTTSYIALCTQALSTSQGDPVREARLWATTQCDWKAMSSATETAELQPLWQLFFTLQSSSPNKSLLS